MGVFIQIRTRAKDRGRTHPCVPEAQCGEGFRHMLGSCCVKTEAVTLTAVGEKWRCLTLIYCTWLNVTGTGRQ